MKLLNKIKDFNDQKVYMVILMDDLDQFGVVADVVVSSGADRCSYEVYKDEIAAYMMELNLPYNRYLAMIQGLRTTGWTFKHETKVGIFNRMIKIEKVIRTKTKTLRNRA